MLQGVLQPDFGQFGYFFMLSTCKISKFAFAMTGLVTTIAFIVGTWCYKQYLKNVETRTLLFWDTIMVIVSQVAGLAWALRWNLKIGINDLIFALLTDVVFGTVSRALNMLPSLALFVKITPKGIEATVFAFLTGTCNLASTVIAPNVGAFINDKFLHMTAKDFEDNKLDGYVKMRWVCLIAAFLPFATLMLIPLSIDLKKWQSERVEEENAKDE